MIRGRNLEPDVIKVVEHQENLCFSSVGLVLNRRRPIFGASPDAINNEYVLEVKCPTTEENIKYYISQDGQVMPKVLAQIQLAMDMTERKKALLCVASHDFEHSKKVQVVRLNYDEGYVNSMVENATQFWKTYVFPNLYNGSAKFFE